MQIKSTIGSVLIGAIVMASYAQCRSSAGLTVAAGSSSEEPINAVIPSPNQEFFGYESSQPDIMRRTDSSISAVAASRTAETQQAAPSETTVPVYVSPFVRSQRSMRSFEPQESSHAPPNYAPRPALTSSPYQSASNIVPGPTNDLKTSASYGHHHGHHDHGHYGYGPSGWLDMGAWTGGKGSFGWYADYPVGGKHGYGRK